MSTSIEPWAQASAGEEAVRRVVSGAMVDCRRDSLWQKLLQVSKLDLELDHHRGKILLTCRTLTLNVLEITHYAELKIIKKSYHIYHETIKK